MIMLSLNTRGLENRLHLLGKAVRATPGQVIREETKGLGQQLVKITPPKGLPQGRKRVQGDLRRVVYAPKAEDVEWRPLKSAIERKSVAAATVLFANKRQPRYTFTSSQAAIAGEHLRLRNAKGRVHRGVKPQIAAFAATAKRHLRDVQERVGWHKAGWARAIMAAGGTVPSWIAKLSGNAGTVIADFDSPNPKVIATALNVKIPGYQRMVDEALATRERITQRKIDAINANKAVNLGFAVFLGKK